MKHRSLSFLVAAVVAALLACVTSTTRASAYAPVWNQSQMAVPINVLTLSWGTAANNDVTVDGELQNVGSVNAEQVQLWVAAYDSAHQMLMATTIATWMDVVGPGEVAPFHGWFGESGKYFPGRTVAVKVTAIDSTVSSRAPNHYFAAVVTDEQTDPSTGDVHILGAVWNLNATPVNYASVVLTFFDPSGAVVDTAQVYVGQARPDGLPPMDSSIPARGTQTFDLRRPASLFTPTSPDDMDLFPQSPTAPAVGAQLTAQVYQDLLGRAADGDGLAYWGGLIDSGRPRYPVALSLTASTEYRAQQVQAQYLRYLRRGTDGDPSSGGLGYWVGSLAGGATYEQLAESLIGSDEYFVTRAHSDNGAYVDALYTDLLGRTPESQGRAYWVDRLDHGAPRWLVSSSILSSTEAVQNLVTGVFQQFLHHAPDASGLAYWTQRVQGGMRDELLIASILSSDEYLFATLTAGS